MTILEQNYLNDVSIPILSGIGSDVNFIVRVNKRQIYNYQLQTYISSQAGFREIDRRTLNPLVLNEDVGIQTIIPSNFTYPVIITTNVWVNGIETGQRVGMAYVSLDKPLPTQEQLITQYQSTLSNAPTQEEINSLFVQLDAFLVTNERVRNETLFLPALTGNQTKDLVNYYHDSIRNSVTKLKNLVSQSKTKQEMQDWITKWGKYVQDFTLWYTQRMKSINPIGDVLGSIAGGIGEIGAKVVLPFSPLILGGLIIFLSMQNKD